MRRYVRGGFWPFVPAFRSSSAFAIITFAPVPPVLSFTVASIVQRKNDSSPGWCKRHRAQEGSIRYSRTTCLQISSVTPITLLPGWSHSYLEAPVVLKLLTRNSGMCSCSVEARRSNSGDIGVKTMEAAASLAKKLLWISSRPPNRPQTGSRTRNRTKLTLSSENGSSRLRRFTSTRMDCA